MNHQLLWAQIITILQLTSFTYMLSLYSMSSGALVDHIHTYKDNNMSAVHDKNL